MQFYLKQIKNEKNLITETSVSVDATSAQVWIALTTPKMVNKYLMETDVTTEWKERSVITYSGEYERKKCPNKGIIKKIDPEIIMQSTYWRSMGGKEDKPENNNLVIYNIPKRDDKTLITLSHNNNVTGKEKEHSTENWKMVVKKLKEVFESR